MAKGEHLKSITYKRLETVKILIAAKDWEAAMYMMGYALECALKAAACKTLELSDYPPLNKNKEDAYFKTHNFEQLLIVSGLSNIMSPRGEISAFRNWSSFAIEYPGEWVKMRYDIDMSNKFTEEKVMALYNNLIEDEDSIINIISRGNRW